ncbi:hypothetical protein IL306_007008 [Fusarium sp. DS 682]|nr:hypothetical protein IL306_007008 [Fusarium sp. DS 682]
MPCRLDTRVLTVNANVIHKVDTGNPINLYSIWTAPTTQTLPRKIPSESRISDLPQLSGSVESLVDEEAVDFASESAPLEIARPRVRRQDSCASIRSKREHHISSDDFEKIVVSIVKDKGPLSASHVAPVVKESLPVPPAFEPSGFTTTESQSPAKSITAPKGSPQPSPKSPPRTTVVRGFSTS